MIDLVMKALAYSNAIALAAAGIAIIYMTTGTFNFAHASKAAFGYYMIFTGFHLLGGLPYYYFPLAALVGGGIGVLIYYTVNKWLLIKEAGMVTLMMSTLGVDLVLFGLLNHYADYITFVHKIEARYVVLEVHDVFVKVGDTTIRMIGIISLMIVIVLIAALHLFLTKTKFGIAMRATVENPTLAKIVGVNPEKVYVFAWFVGGTLAALGGAVVSLIQAAGPEIGVSLIVTMFAGSIVGGLYSVFGSLLGGFLVGISEYVGIYLLSINLGGWILAYRPAIPLAIMAATLLVYPSGLAGIRIKRRRT